MFSQVEQRRVEEEPSQHLLVLHRLRYVVESGEARARRRRGLRIEIDVPVAAKIGPVVDEIDEAAAEPAHRRDVDLARADDLPKGLIEKLGGSGAGRRG